MLRIVLFAIFLLNTIPFTAGAKESKNDQTAVIQAARDYIESQHKSSKEQMGRALHPKLTKRTYWKAKSGSEFVMETSREAMLNVAENYNLKGDKFPQSPRIDIKILDIDQRIASVKLSADDWVDYMHLMKNQQGHWQIINVLWQYHDINKHSSKR